jgi:hypothetical protein
MSTQRPSPPDPFYLAFSRKLVLLLLMAITTAILLVTLLRQIRLSIPVLAFLLSDGIVGLVAGFSVRWIITKKNLFLFILVVLMFISTSLALLGWFTGWSFGIDLIEVGRIRMGVWDIVQVLTSVGFALLARFAWLKPARVIPVEPRTKAAQAVPGTRRKAQKRATRPARSDPVPADPAPEGQPASSLAIARPAKTKRKRSDQAHPKLLLSGPEEHRCPYCLELVEPEDPRGVVECEICHTLHHADCWAITGACQVPHFTS